MCTFSPCRCLVHLLSMLRTLGGVPSELPCAPSLHAGALHTFSPCFGPWEVSPLSCLVHLLSMQVPCAPSLHAGVLCTFSPCRCRSFSGSGASGLCCSLAARCSHRGWLAMLGLVTGGAGRESGMIAGGAPPGPENAGTSLLPVKLSGPANEKSGAQGQPWLQDFGPPDPKTCAGGACSLHYHRSGSEPSFIWSPGQIQRSWPQGFHPVKRWASLE